jgi:hypothetical protein
MATQSLRARVNDSILAVGSAGVLLGGLAAIDVRVRDLLSHVFSSESIRQLSSVTLQSRRFAQSAMEAVGYRGTEDASMIYMAVVAVVLVVLMLRT